jgi:hypothetical protein
MEIDITDFVRTCEPFDFSRSAAEAGDRASPDSWNNAKREAAETPLLTTEGQLNAMRQWVKESGGWDKAEREAMTDEDLNAMFLQLVSGDMREAGMDDVDLGDFDWDAYYERAEAGRISGNIFRGDVEGSAGFGRIFYSLGI